LEHVVVACGEASVKEPGNPSESVLYSTQILQSGSVPFSVRDYLTVIVVPEKRRHEKEESVLLMQAVIF
jgi:hypothetical protein